MDREESFGGASINGAKGATNDSRTTQQVCVCVGLGERAKRG